MGIAEWVEFYNFERTHMGLPSGEVPADRFLYGWNKMPSPNAAVQMPTETSKSSEDVVWAEILKMALSKIK